MKRQFPLLAALLVSTSAAFAGSFGPGPWANGAYYPGQFDGKYTAAMYGTNVSGVLAFGLEGGTFTTGVTDVNQVGSNNLVNTISVDPLQNYFLAFVEGRTYAGTCIAQINNNAGVVSGSLFNGQAQPTIVAFTNISITVVGSNNGVPFNNTNITTEFREFANTANGGFTANITSDKAVVAFVGNNTGTLSESFNGIPSKTNTFSLNGLKTSDTTTSATSTNSTP